MPSIPNCLCSRRILRRIRRRVGLGGRLVVENNSDLRDE